MKLPRLKHRSLPGDEWPEYLVILAVLHLVIFLPGAFSLARLFGFGLLICLAVQVCEQWHPGSKAPARVRFRHYLRVGLVALLVGAIWAALWWLVFAAYRAWA